MDFFSDVSALFSAILSNDAWMISEALKTSSVWITGVSRLCWELCSSW